MGGGATIFFMEEGNSIFPQTVGDGSLLFWRCYNKRRYFFYRVKGVVCGGAILFYQR
jgi:hypothetical protein